MHSVRRQAMDRFKGTSRCSKWTDILALRMEQCLMEHEKLHKKLLNGVYKLLKFKKPERSLRAIKSQ
jgi:hypothetical protein